MCVVQVDKAVWDACNRISKEAEGKVKGVHFDRGQKGWLMLEMGADGTPRVPKVPLTDDT